MSLWRRTVAEVAGAWRSLRYDLGRRPAEPPAGGPDVTSTGMYTFGGQSMELSAEVGAAASRRPRRALAVSALGLLTVTGAVAAYLGVVNGLMPTLAERPAAAGTLPPAASPADAGIGSGRPLPRRPRVRRSPLAPTAITAPGGAALPAPPVHTAPMRTVKPTSRECLCTPPVPTPTAPTASPSPTPSAPDPSSAAPTPSDPPSAGDESPEPDATVEGRRHRHHHY